MSTKQNKQHNSDKKESQETVDRSQEQTVTEEVTAVLEEIIEETKPEKVKGEIVTLTDETNLLIGDRPYRIVTDYREGFNAEKLGERYSEVLSRYDYIVGDWGYEQLRLKGFFDATNRRAHPDQRIDALEDYLYEYCNFGCAYFVIERIGGKKEKNTQRRKKKKNPNRNNQAHIDEKKAPVESVRKQPVIKNRKPATTKATPMGTEKTSERPTKSTSKKNFTIRQREE